MELIANHKIDIQTNMEDLALQIQGDIKDKYDVIVTEDTVKSSKDLMAQINKDRDEFSGNYRKFKDEALKPFEPLDAKAKEIVGFYNTARSAVESQVKSYEAKILELAKEVCELYRQQQCEEKSIDVNSIVIDDISELLGSVTAKGDISKSAKDKIDQRIQAVEIQVLKAQQEAAEKAAREKEIADKARAEAEEKSKQREAELIAKAEREKLEAVADATAKVISEAKQTMSEAATDEDLKKTLGIPDEPVIEDGKRTFYIMAYFEVTHYADATHEKIKGQLQTRMEAAGIKSLKSIEVR